MQELIKKIDKIIKTKFPNYSDKEIKEMMQDYSEIIFLEVTNKITDELQNEDAEAFVKMFEAGKFDKGVEFAISKGVNIEKIFEDVSKKVVVHIFS